MGCHNFCQSPEVDDNHMVTDPNTSSQLSISNIKSRNRQNTTQRTESNYKISLNIESTIIDYKHSSYIIKASNIRQILPIWIEKGEKIIFKVKGKWGFEEHDELFDEKGCVLFDDRPNNLNFGCLVGYISFNECINIVDNLSFISNHSGALHIFQNNGLYSVTPIGSLELSIEGASPLGIYEIESRKGWDINKLDTSIQEMNEEEIKFLILLNKLRSNQILFISEFLNENSNNKEELELIKYLLSYSKDNLNKEYILKTTSKVYNLSKNHAIDLSINKLAGHYSSNGDMMEQRLVKNNINTKIFAENCIFGFNDPIEIIMRMLIDEDNINKNQRKILMNREFNYVGVVIEPHHGDYCWSCVLDFMYLNSEDLN